MRLDGQRIRLEDKVTLSKCAQSMLGDMCNFVEESVQEYGVYLNVKLQPFLATYFAFRHGEQGGYGRLASKAEVFREESDLTQWFTWDYDQACEVPLTEVSNPNIAPKGRRRKCHN